MYDETYTWRYAVNAEGTITRGRPYRLNDSDSWEFYWESESMVAFTVDWHYGSSHVIPIKGTDTEAGERATVAYKAERDGLTDGAMKRLAVRLAEKPEAEFIHVSLDRGTDLYALSYDGDPEGTWRREIEALYNGEVYRMETQDFYPHVGETGVWMSADDWCEEWYGSDNAEAAQAEAYPLTEFPAELLVDGSN